MIFRFLRVFYYYLFCTHYNRKSEKYYRIENSFGTVIRVYVCRVCEKCGKTETFCVSEYSGAVWELDKVRARLEAKGIKNLEDIDDD